MSLLTNLMDHSLDEGYAEAAARRGGQPAESTRRPGWLLAVGLLVVGVLLATAAAQVRDRAPAAAEARTELAREVADRTAANDALEGRLERLRESVTKARADALTLTTEGSRLSEELTGLEGATGAGPVTGPALVLHLENAADSTADGGDPADVDPRTGGPTTASRISDRDLQLVVNAMWSAGAEAVAVNGQRLTTLSAIRSAGEAVLVDFRPLSPPYDVVAIGDPDDLRTDFTEGFGGTYLQVLRDVGIQHRFRTEDGVRLPASAGVDVRYARTGPEPTATPSTEDMP